MAGERQPVLAVAQDVPAGQVIEAGDLREVQVAADAGVVPAAEAASVIGQVAAVPLAGGSLLAPGQVGSEGAYPPEGLSEVSFAVTAGGAPEVERGQRVAVFPGPASTASLTDEAPDAAVSPVVGTVTQVIERGEAEGGEREVSVLIESVAAERAAGVEDPRVVVLTPGGESW
jgi:hypothetical protein